MVLVCGDHRIDIVLLVLGSCVAHGNGLANHAQAEIDGDGFGVHLRSLGHGIAKHSCVILERLRHLGTGQRGHVLVRVERQITRLFVDENVVRFLERLRIDGSEGFLTRAKEARLFIA